MMIDNRNRHARHGIPMDGLGHGWHARRAADGIVGGVPVDPPLPESRTGAARDRAGQAAVERPAGNPRPRCPGEGAMDTKGMQIRAPATGPAARLGGDILLTRVTRPAIALVANRRGRPRRRGGRCGAALVPPRAAAEGACGAARDLVHREVSCRSTGAGSTMRRRIDQGCRLHDDGRPRTSRLHEYPV